MSIITPLYDGVGSGDLRLSSVDKSTRKVLAAADCSCVPIRAAAYSDRPVNNVYSVFASRTLRRLIHLHMCTVFRSCVVPGVAD